VARLLFALISGFIVTLISSVCLWLWYRADGGNEAWYGAVASTGACVVTAIGVILDLLFDDEIQKRRLQKREELKAFLEPLRKRIERERTNFEDVAAKNTHLNRYSLEYSEITPFKLLADELSKVRSHARYRVLADKLLEEIALIQEMPPNEKDMSRFMPLLAELEAKMLRDAA
jgi:hypothetical protein